MRCKPHSCGQLAVGVRPVDELRDCVHLTRLSAARRLSESAVSGACGGARAVERRDQWKFEKHPASVEPSQENVAAYLRMQFELDEIVNE